MDELKELLNNPFVFAALIFFIIILIVSLFAFFALKTANKIKDELDENSFRNE